MAFKLAVIGAGSIGFTRTLIRDLLCIKEFRNDPAIEIALHDISAKNLEMITQLINKELKDNDCRVKITSALERRAALKDAKYVLNLTRIGGLEAFKHDVEVPLKYGVDQCVGDTLCAGGIMYGQRNIAAVLDFCKDMREVSAPDVLFLNYANPNAINTWAANTYGGIKTLGLCHGVHGGHKQIANVIELLINKGADKESPDYQKVTTDEVDVICAGINHQTWYISVKYKGEDWCDRLLEGFRAHPEYSKTEKVRIDMLSRFDYYSTESNGHLSEYLPWYRKRAAEIERWIDLSEWIHGETGGYLRVCTEGRNWFETDFPNWLKEETPKFSEELRGHEHASYIIESLELGKINRCHINTINNGCISNLPDDCVVEVPAYLDKNGINIPKVGELPAACAAICQNSINVQRLAVNAGVKGDVKTLKQAMMLDPLVGAVCNPDEVWQMTDEMLLATAPWLPQYDPVMPEVRERFNSAQKLGTKNTEGAARLKTRTAEEIRSDEKAKEMAAKADKGGF